MVPASLIRSTFPVGIAYFVCSALSVSLTRFDGGVAFLWVSAAIMIAALRVRPLPEWPVVVLACGFASLLATGLFGLGWSYAVPFTVINVVEGLVGAEMLRRSRKFRSSLGSLGWMLEFTIPIGVIAPGIATAMLVIMASLSGNDATSSALTFFCGHALGNLAFTPLTRIIARDGFGSIWRELSVHGAREPLALLTATLVISAIVFSQERVPLLFLPILPLIMVAFRLGFAGSALGLVIVAIVGGAFTLSGHGPVQLFRTGVGEQVQFLQFFLASITLTLFPVAADLQNRRALHSEVKLSEARFRLLADYSTDVVMHIGKSWKVLYASPSIERFMPYDRASMTVDGPVTFIVPEDMPVVRKGHAATLAAAGETITFEYRAKTREGEIRWLEAHSRAVIHEDGSDGGVITMMRDITARKANEQRLSHEALTDTLTALPNRRSFEEAVARCEADDRLGSTDCVAIFDIDRFKRVNDTFGHDAGDAVLQTFADVLRRVVRQGDAIARLGGEEFAVLFPSTGVPQALLVCDRLRTEMAAASTHVAGKEIRVTVSGGVALLGPQGIEVALKQADQALYAAKRGGRDQMALAA